MLPVLQIGPLAVQTPGLVLILGFWLALEVAGRFAARRGLDGAALQNAGLYGLLAGILAARLAHVIRFWDLYRTNLRGILSLNPQTLLPAAGLAVGLLVAALFIWRRRLSFWPVLDSLAPAGAVLAISLSLANFLGGSAFGVETGLPWAIELWGARRHPAQLYELLAGLAILALLWWAARDVSAPGLLFPLFVALYAGARLLLEPFRADSLLLPGGIRLSQVIALVALMVALVVMRLRIIRQPVPPGPDPTLKSSDSA
jgi:prolipoprotein diacylglyceryltransferase